MLDEHLVEETHGAQIEWLNGIQMFGMDMGTALDFVTFREGVCWSTVIRPVQGGKIKDKGYIITTIYRSFYHSLDAVILDVTTLDILCQIELDPIIYCIISMFIL